MPLVRRTRATLRNAEFGFFGVVVYTRVHTPRRCGAATFFLRPLPDLRPGVASFFFGAVRPLRISWLVVGRRSANVSRPSAVRAATARTMPRPIHTATATGPHIDAHSCRIYDAVMRTTIDLDPDVDARLRALARER